QELELRARCADAQPFEVTEARRATRLGFAPPRPLILLVSSLDVASYLQSPRLHRVTREAQLAVWNADLRGPSVFIDVRRRFPDRIPRRVATGRPDSDVVVLGP